VGGVSARFEFEFEWATCVGGVNGRCEWTCMGGVHRRGAWEVWNVRCARRCQKETGHTHKHTTRTAAYNKRPREGTPPSLNNDRRWRDDGAYRMGGVRMRCAWCGKGRCELEVCIGDMMGGVHGRCGWRCELEV